MTREEEDRKLFELYKLMLEKACYPEEDVIPSMNERLRNRAYVNAYKMAAAALDVYRTGGQPDA